MLQNAVMSGAEGARHGDALSWQRPTGFSALLYHFSDFLLGTTGHATRGHGWAAGVPERSACRAFQKAPKALEKACRIFLGDPVSGAGDVNLADIIGDLAHHLRPSAALSC